MRKLDVILIHPGSTAAQYQGLGAEFSAIEPPSLCALFATYLTKQGLAVDIIDQPASGDSAEVIASQVLAEMPTLVVIVVYGFQPSASTQNMPAAMEIAAMIHLLDPSIKVAMTGTHPAALPERTMNEASVDFVIASEGPQTIAQLAKALVVKGDVYRIPGLWFYGDGDDPVKSGGTVKLLDDLDAAMPGGAWGLLPMDKYRAHNWHCFDDIDKRQPYVSIHTSLGCPYKCSFCCINAPFGGPNYRMWSPKVVVDELWMLVERWGVRNVKFVDEMFVLNRAHVAGICDMLIDRNLGDELNIWAYARVDTVDRADLHRMRQAGFRWLALGIESASKHVRDGVEKGRFGSEDIIKTVRKIQAAGINVIGNYIFGLPDDTYESMEDTLRLALEANCEFANFYSAMAYPGSKLHADFMRMEPAALPEEPGGPGWIGYSQHSYETHPLPSLTLTNKQVLQFRDTAFTQYYSHPRYRQMVQAKFGAPVVDHIARMVAQPLPRKLLNG